MMSSYFVVTCLFVALMIPGIQSECLKALNSKCKTDSECGDYNGFQLKCIISINEKQGDTFCLCPPNTNCDKPKKGLPLFAECSPTKNCVVGSGLANGGATPGGCVERIACVERISTAPTELPFYACHTCTSCRDQGHGSNSRAPTFKCDDLCNGNLTALATLVPDSNSSSSSASASASLDGSTGFNSSSGSASTLDDLLPLIKTAAPRAASISHSNPIEISLAAVFVVVAAAFF